MKYLGAANYILGMEIKRYQAKRKQPEEVCQDNTIEV